MTLDIQALYALNAFVGRSLLLDNVIFFLASTLAYVLIALFLIILVTFVQEQRARLELFTTAFIATVFARFGVTELIRLGYHRPRPFVDLVANPLFTDPAWSFPSGHATFFFALSTVVYLSHRGWGVLFFTLSVVMTVARVAAGVHYPSDVIGGAIIGILVAYVSHILVLRFWPKAPH
ncbi:MAG: phosphatase PAP2 family protein [Patescibacteria group bacterium]